MTEAMDMDGRLDQLVRAGLMPTSSLPLLKRAISRMHAGMSLQGAERDVMNMFISSMMFIVLGDDSIFNKARVGAKGYAAEEVDMGQAERGMRSSSRHTGGYHVVDKAGKVVSKHANQGAAMRAALENDDHRVKAIKEAKEKTEYDYEGDMAMSQLKSIIANSQRMHDMLSDDTNLPEWVQSKITLAEDYISTASNYMQGEMNESKDGMPFKGPYRKVGERKDKYGNTVKNVPKFLAKKAMNKQKNEEIDPDLEAELKATRVTKKSMEDSKKTRERASGVKEEAEELEELSTNTLRSYRAKAKDDAYDAADVDDDRRLRKRSMGSWDAGKKILKRGDALRKEEVESIDEILDTPKKAADYKAKAEKSFKDNIWKGGAKAVRTTTKRLYGLSHPKIAEEVEIEEKLDMKKASMGTVVKDFQKSDAPQFMGKSQKKRQVMAIAAKLSAERGDKPLNKEERLLTKLADISETHQRTMISVFEKLNEDNQYAFMQACDTADGIEQMLDFSISYRGE
jgi:hypothetical protein